MFPVFMTHRDLLLEDMLRNDFFFLVFTLWNLQIFLLKAKENIFLSNCLRMTCHMSDFYTNGSCTDSSVVFYMNPWYYLVYIFLRRLESCRSVCVMCLFFFIFCVCVCGEAKRAVLLAPPSPSPPLELKEKVMMEVISEPSGILCE